MYTKNLRIARLALIFIFCFSPCRSFSYEVISSASLLDVYSQALDNSPSMKIANANRGVADEAFKQARAKAYFPTLSLSASYTNYTVDTVLQSKYSSLAGNYTDGKDNHLNSEYTFTLTQPLFRPDKIIAKNQANLDIKRSDQDFVRYRQDLIVRVAESYFDILISMDSLRFIDAQKVSLARQLEESKEKFMVGAIPIMNLSESEAGYARAEADEIEARQLLSSAKAALREIAGLDYVTLLGLAKDVSLKLPEPMDENYWLDQAVARSSSIISKATKVEIASQEIKRLGAENLPYVDIVASSGYSRPHGQDEKFGPANITKNLIGISVGLNLFEGGQSSSRVRSAIFALEEAKAVLEQERRAIIRQTHDAFYGLVSGHSRITALQKTIQSQQFSVDNIRLSIEVGSRSALDLVLAEQELFRIQRDYSKARYGYLLNLLRLKRAAGVLQEEDLLQLNKLLGSSS